MSLLESFFYSILIGVRVIYLGVLAGAEGGGKEKVVDGGPSGSSGAGYGVVQLRQITTPHALPLLRLLLFQNSDTGVSLHNLYDILKLINLFQIHIILSTLI